MCDRETVYCIFIGDESSEEIIPSDSDSEQSVSSLPRRVTRSQSTINTPELAKPPAPKQTPKRHRVPLDTSSCLLKKHNTRSASRYGIETRSNKNRNNKIVIREPVSHKKINTNKLKSNLKLRKINLSTKKIETAIQISKKLRSRNQENKVSEKPILLENKDTEFNPKELTTDMNTPKLDTFVESGSENMSDSKGNMSLDTNSSSRMLDVKISLVPCSPRTPKKHTNNKNNKQVCCLFTIVEPR